MSTFLSETRCWTQAKVATQGVLLQSLASEPQHVVRRAVADVAAVVAKHTVPRNQWPELLGVLQQWSQVHRAAAVQLVTSLTLTLIFICQGASASHRELALTLFSSLAESIGAR